MGAVGGSIYHSVKGSWTSPRGSKFRGGLSAVKARAPVLGGNFAVWGGCFAWGGGERVASGAASRGRIGLDWVGLGWTMG